MKDEKISLYFDFHCQVTLYPGLNKVELHGKAGVQGIYTLSQVVHIFLHFCTDCHSGFELRNVVLLPKTFEQ